MTIEEVIAANTAAVEENTAAIRELIELIKQDQSFKGAALCVQNTDAEPAKNTDEVVDDRVEDEFPLPADFVRKAFEAKQNKEELTTAQKEAIDFKNHMIRMLQAAFTSGKSAALSSVFQQFDSTGLKDFAGDYRELDSAMRKAGIYA